MKSCLYTLLYSIFLILTLSSCHDTGISPDEPILPIDTLITPLLGKYMGTCYATDYDYDFPTSTYNVTRDTLQCELEIDSIIKEQSSYIIHVKGTLHYKYYIIHEYFKMDTFEVSQHVGHTRTKLIFVRSEQSIYRFTQTNDQWGPGRFVYEGFYEKQ